MALSRTWLAQAATSHQTVARFGRKSIDFEIRHSHQRKKNWLRPRCSVMSQNLTSHLQNTRRNHCTMRVRGKQKVFQWCRPCAKTRRLPLGHWCSSQDQGSPSSAPKLRGSLPAGRPFTKKLLQRHLRPLKKRNGHRLPMGLHGCSTALANMPCDFRPLLRKNKNTKLRTR